MNDSQEVPASATAEAAAPVAEPSADDAVAKSAEPRKAKNKFLAILDPDVMKRVLPIVKKIINTRSTNPITQNILLTATGSTLTLTVTDLEVAFTGPVGTCDGEGSALITCDWLAGAIELKVNGQKALVTSKNNTREFHGQDPEEFPVCFRQSDADYRCACDADKLVDAIEATVRSIAHEKGRYALNGVLFELEEKHLGLCGTDGRRLAFRRLDAQGSAEKGSKADFKKNGTKYQIIVPAKALNCLPQLSRLGEGELAMAISENRIEFSRGQYRLRSLLVDGQFPDWRSVIPKDLDKVVIFEREAALAAFTEARTYTSIESQAMRLELDEQGLTWRTKSPVHGSACGKIAVQTIPEPMAIGFDPQYLLAGLESLSGRYVALELKDEETAAVLHDGRKDEAFYLVMPIDI